MIKNFLDFLIGEKIIDRKIARKIDVEAKKSQQLPEDLLVEQGLIGEGRLIETRSKFFNIPIRTLFEGEKIAEDVLRSIPEDTARLYGIAPLGRDANHLEIGIVNPDDIRAREAMQFLALKLGVKIKFFLISPPILNSILKQYKTLKGEVTGALKAFEQEVTEKGFKPEAREEKITVVTEEAPISKIVAVFLRHAVEGGASDIHVEPTAKNLRVRYRMDGVLYTSLLLPINIHPAVIARIKILSNMKLDETRIPQDGRFRTKVDEKEVDLRISTLPTIFGEKVAMRILDPNFAMQSLDELGLRGRNLDIFKEGLKKPYGMILITGPTGSGKSTTLYVAINMLDKEGTNIVTLEDPVEYWIGGINQSQINADLHYSFASGLRNILRQDPDTIMVGEIRDEETAGLATHAALTGHLVFSTLHTNDALGVVPRLIDMKVASFLISSSLSIAVAQRLVRKICPDCKEKVQASPSIEDLILKELSTLPPDIKKDLKISKPVYLYKSKGCKLCGFKGSRGRIGIFEVVSMTRELEKIILERPSESAIKEEAERQGMISIKQDGILKALEGIVSFDEVLKAVEF